jgi:SAM-dependent methyltransferase
MLVKFLTYVRDARLVWDVMGPVYNRRICGAISELYDHIAREMRTEAPVRILDVGSGRGYMSLLLAAQNPEASITGIDFSPMQVRSAERLGRQRGIDNCRFHRGDAMQIPYHDETFDAVVSVGSIKHWPDDLRGLREIHRVLRSGGRFVISETDRGASDEALRQFVSRFSIWFIWDALLFWGLRHVVFGQSYTEEGLESLTRTAGFRNVACQRVPACPYTVVKGQK